MLAPRAELAGAARSIRGNQRRRDLWNQTGSNPGSRLLAVWAGDGYGPARRMPAGGRRAGGSSVRARGQLFAASRAARRVEAAFSLATRAVSAALSTTASVPFAVCAVTDGALSLLGHGLGGLEGGRRPLLGQLALIGQHLLGEVEVLVDDARQVGQLPLTGGRLAGEALHGVGPAGSAVLLDQHKDESPCWRSNPSSCWRSTRIVAGRSGDRAARWRAARCCPARVARERRLSRSPPRLRRRRAGRRRRRLRAGRRRRFRAARGAPGWRVPRRRRDGRRPSVPARTRWP